jgi:hypothetical protein
MTKGADIIAAIILLALAIAIIVYLLHWLYRRSSKEVSFCKDGNAWRKSCYIRRSICFTYNS